MTDESGLNAAINDPSVTNIKLDSNITVTSPVTFDKKITFNGDGNQLETSNTGSTVIFLKDATVSNLEVTSTADNESWNKSYGVQFYTGNHTLDNAKLSGCNAGMLVNGATVTLQGTIDVSNNTFGGIEVSKGSGEGLSASIINIANAKLVNNTEAYGKPTIWIDGTTDDIGIVNGADNLTRVEIKNQIHYYIDAKNAQNPSE